MECTGACGRRREYGDYPTGTVIWSWTLAVGPARVRVIGGDVRFQTLGPLQVWNGTTWLPVPAAQQRVLLAVLLAKAGRVVSTDSLAEELWGSTPPKRATSTIQVYVGRLRRLLGDGADRLVTRG